MKPVLALYISHDGLMDPLGQSQIVQYLKKLTKKGIYFNLLTFDKPRNLEKTDKVERLEEDLAAQGIKWTYLKYHRRPKVLSTACDLLRGVLVGAGIVKLNNISIVHARGYPPALIALILKKLFKLKFIFDVRGLWPDEKADAGAWSRKGLLYKITKHLEKIFFLNADAVIVLTKKAKDILEAFPYYKYNPIKINVIPTCVDLDRFRIFEMSNKLPNELENKFVIVYVGSLGTWYMLDEMIDFFKVANRINSDTFFLILTPYKNFVKKRMHKKGINKMDFNVDFVAYEEIPKWISVADAAIFFIRPSYSKKSSCPTKFAESLACGLPIITNSDIGDTEEIIKREKVGVIVESFNENSYRKAMSELLTLLQEGPKLRERCRTTAIKYFSLQDGANRYLQIYRDIFN